MNRPAPRVVYSAAMTFPLRSLTAAMFLSLALLLTGCGSADIGEQCDTAGSVDECVDGAICTNDTANTCRAVCVEQADCPVDYSCNGVSGSSTKSCQPDAI